MWHKSTMVKSMLHERKMQNQSWKPQILFLNDGCVISDCREHKQNMDHLIKKNS